MTGVIHRESSSGHPEGLDYRARLLILLVFIACVVSTGPGKLTAFAAWGGMTAWASELAGVSLRTTFRRAVSVLPFSLVTAAWLPFGGGGSTVDLLGMNLSEKGLWTLAAVSMKSTLSAAMLTIVVSSTGFDGAVSAMRGLGMPSFFADILSLSWRYLFLLAREAEKLRRTAASRGFRPRWLPQAVTIGRMAGSLFVRSYERAERVHGAMVMRGYGVHLPKSSQKALRLSDAVQSALAISSFLAVRVVLG